MKTASHSMDQLAVPCTIMRGGTSKGVFFLESDLPADPQLRERVLLEAMGSPDPRQIDGLGGADTLTSKIVIVSKSAAPGIDLDYTFGQVGIDLPYVSYSANCGNLSAAVGTFAIQEGLIKAVEPVKTPVTLAAIKAELPDMVLAKNSRLSVQPVTADEWKKVCKMAGLKS